MNHRLSFLRIFEAIDYHVVSSINNGRVLTKSYSRQLPKNRFVREQLDAKGIRATNEILRNTFTCIPDVTTKIVQWIRTKSTSWDNLTNTTSSRILTKSRIFSVMIDTSGHCACNRSLVNMTLLFTLIVIIVVAVRTLDHRQAIRVLT